MEPKDYTVVFDALRVSEAGDFGVEISIDKEETDGIDELRRLSEQFALPETASYTLA